MSTPRIDFNWGYHDGIAAAYARRSYHSIDGNKAASTAYKAGWRAGFNHFRDVGNERNADSQNAWIEYSRKKNPRKRVYMGIPTYRKNYPSKMKRIIRRVGRKIYGKTFGHKPRRKNPRNRFAAGSTAFHRKLVAYLVSQGMEKSLAYDVAQRAIFQHRESKRKRSDFKIGKIRFTIGTK
jgi:hypothetical protein